MDYLENFFKGFICIHILVTMDPRHTDAEDEQFLLNMIAEGQGDVPEQADDGSNTDIYLNMSGDGIEPPSIQDDAAGEQRANVHITTNKYSCDMYISTLFTSSVILKRWCLNSITGHIQIYVGIAAIISLFRGISLTFGNHIHVRLPRLGVAGSL